MSSLSQRVIIGWQKRGGRKIITVCGLGTDCNTTCACMYSSKQRVAQQVMHIPGTGTAAAPAEAAGRSLGSQDTALRMVPAKCGITVVATRLLCGSLLRAHATESTPRRQLGNTAGHPLQERTMINTVSRGITGLCRCRGHLQLGVKMKQLLPSPDLQSTRAPGIRPTALNYCRCDSVRTEPFIDMFLLSTAFAQQLHEWSVVVAGWPRKRS